MNEGAGRRGRGASKARATVQAVAVSTALTEPQRALLGAIARELRARGAAPARPDGGGTVALVVTSDRASVLAAGAALARERNVELYRVDLARVVSRYIGETEKNLDALFDQAERRGGILLFDEADALFGRRTEAGDAHDRYAGLDRAAVRERLIRFGGVAILVTQRPETLDEAVVRRARCTLEWPPR